MTTHGFTHGICYDDVTHPATSLDGMVVANQIPLMLIEEWDNFFLIYIYIYLWFPSGMIRATQVKSHLSF